MNDLNRNRSVATAFHDERVDVLVDDELLESAAADFSARPKGAA
jgi:hypothetical protein